MRHVISQADPQAEFVNRKPIKDNREKNELIRFLKWLNARCSTNWEIVARPDPPDALIQWGRLTSWIEHTDVPRNSEEAHELFSVMTPGEAIYRHKGQSIVGTDVFPEAFIVRLDSKLTKNSYAPIAQQYGPGLLLLTEMDPLFDTDTLLAIKERISNYLQASPQGGRGFFHSVYLGYWDNDHARFEHEMLASFPRS